MWNLLFKGVKQKWNCYLAYNFWKIKEKGKRSETL
jgi:hypothetical protein